ncbi:hypothetical protein EDB92DRAFT_1813198 [Lactarius akahatsu]|uniref:Pentatricopeptide repeat-containing protein n=1 Tax=Lactarius akahatsu TaxID=416441 RepID=A0AAD4QEU4_9AGAM|nr:hypothetical protein EDB92DRAFT_1813198 [Lactarius akahatsu]
MLSRFALLVPRSRCTSFRIPLFPLLRHPRLFASRFNSQALSFGDFETKRRQWSRINQLILSVSRLLKQEKNEEAVELFKNRVSEIPSKDRTSRFSAYERGITAFLNHKLYKNAVEFDQQMLTEGMFSSSGLRAKVLVCSDIVTTLHEQREELEPLYEKLSRVLSLSSYSERSLRELLDVMRDHPLIDLEFVRKLVDVYVESRGPEYVLESSTINKLILLYVHAGSMDTAESLVLQNREPADDHPRHTNAGPYTTLISELTEKGAMSSRRLGILLDQMQQSHISVDLPLMNALVQSAVRRGDFHQAFAMYETILRDPASHMIPDSFVFGSLFNALQPRSSGAHANLRTHPRPAGSSAKCSSVTVLAAQAADPRTRPVVVRVSTLNVALRLFMLSMDYPGAFVTLRTFQALGLRPDARSYRFVLTILLAHVKAGLQPPQSGRPRRPYVSWVVDFLGAEGWAGLQPEDVWPKVAHALLEFARGVGDTRFRTPELAVIMEDNKGDENAEWDIEPLERLLARAILATMALRGVSEERAERALREKLARYFYEMVPDRLWKGRRLRRATC